MWWWSCWVTVGALGVLLHGGAALAAGAVPGPASAPSTILVDADTGQTLSEQGADVSLPTAGLSQLMVMLLSIEQAELGSLPLATPVTVSALAAECGSAPTRIPLHADKAYLLGDLLKAMVVTSAFDAEVAVAEAIAGSVPACLDLMNARAQRLGMAATHYGELAVDNSAGSGTTTARDVARVAQALLQHESILQWASLSGFPFDHGTTLLRNVNQLLGAVNGVDGLWVAAVDAVGGRGTTTRGGADHTVGGGRAMFDIVATARRQSLRLIAVVLGATDSATRYNKTTELLDWGFAHFERLDVVKPGEPLNFEVRVSNGGTTQLTPVAGRAVSLLRRRDEERDLQIRYQVPTVIAAPVKRHQVIGELIVQEHGELVAVVPVVSPQSISASSVLSAALP